MISPKLFKKHKGLLTAAALGVVLLPLMLLGLFRLFYLDKVYPGLIVGNESLGGKTQIEAEAVLQQRAADAINKQPAVSLVFEGNAWHILKAEIDFEYLPQVAALKAYRVGREGGIRENLVNQFEVLVKKRELVFDYTYDESLLESRVASIAAELDIPLVPTEIEVLDRPRTDGSWTRVVEGEPGRKVEQGALKKVIVEALAWGREEVVEIPVNKLGALVSDERMRITKQRAEKLITKNISLASGEQEFGIEKKTLVGFLNFEEGFDEEKIALYIEGLAEGIDRPSQDAAFQYVGGRVTEFRAAKDGLVLDKEQTFKDLVDLIEEVEDDEKEIFVLKLEIVRSAPKITLAEVNNLGIKELLGKGLSTFRGSIAGRVHNVGLSATRINGVLVPPGKEFSFNASVGEISGATGYQPAYVIKSGSTVLDDGGGVCQTSTTLFRAVLDAGLPVTQRSAHSYRVGYYEQNAKPGLDATVYSPSVDLKFLNDTANHVLVQTITNTGARTMSVEIYGTSDGRVSEITNHRVWDVVPAPPPRYQDDPSLPPGITKQVDYAASGAKAKFDYVVKRDGQVIHSKTFYSNFRPWQAVYLRGV